MKKTRYGLGLLIITLIMFVSGSAWAYIITGDKTGGDCELVGTWNGKTKTCTLTMDLYADNTNIHQGNNGFQYFIEIGGSGLTLDGNGHTVDGSAFAVPGDHLSGVYMYRQRSNTIRNLNLSDFSVGILISVGTGNTVVGNTVTGSYNGIAVSSDSKGNLITGNSVINNSPIGISISSFSNTVSSNVISGNGQGMWLAQGKDNSITNNVFSGNGLGLYITSWENIISGNTFSDNFSGDLGLNYSYNNMIYNNNFMSNSNLSLNATATSPSSFNEALPAGGNYWSVYDSTEEGCIDNDTNGICDQPFFIHEITSVWADNLPWATPDGWLNSSGGSGGGDSGGGGSTKGGGKGGGGKPTR